MGAAVPWPREGVRGSQSTFLQQSRALFQMAAILCPLGTAQDLDPVLLGPRATPTCQPANGQGTIPRTGKHQPENWLCFHAGNQLEFVEIHHNSPRLQTCIRHHNSESGSSTLRCPRLPFVWFRRSCRTRWEFFQVEFAACHQKALSSVKKCFQIGASCEEDPWPVPGLRCRTMVCLC